MTRVTILTRQIGHYHDARYRGAAAYFDNVTVISTANQGAFPEFLAQDIGNYDVSPLYDSRAQYNQAVVQGSLGAALERALFSATPDAIAISGWSNPESMIAIGWGLKNRIPLIVQSESQADDAKRFAFREAIKRHIVSLCDAALVGGPTHASYMASLGIPANRIYLGYNAVDNQHFFNGANIARSSAEKLRKQMALPNRYILASARFIAKKNLVNLVEAYSDATKLVGSAPDLVILGEGDQKDAIIKAIARSGVSKRVHLFGFKSYEVLPSFYGLSEGFVHVSSVEQWGLVINEAMAAGVPVVASDRCGATRSLIEHNRSGLIVTPERNSIRDGLMQLFSLQPSARNEMGLSAQQTIEKWGPQQFGIGLKAAVDSAISAPYRSSPAIWDKILLSYFQKKAIERVA